MDITLYTFKRPSTSQNFTKTRKEGEGKKRTRPIDRSRVLRANSRDVGRLNHKSDSKIAKNCLKLYGVHWSH